MRAKYVPSTQLVQLEAPVETWYLPMSQLVHALAPATVYLPGAHFVQLLDPSKLVAYVPAGHGVQKYWPFEAWYIPTAQGVHAAAPWAVYVPTAQTRQRNDAKVPVDGP